MALLMIAGGGKTAYFDHNAVVSIHVDDDAEPGGQAAKLNFINEAASVTLNDVQWDEYKTWMRTGQEQSRVPMLPPKQTRQPSPSY